MNGRAILLSPKRAALPLSVWPAYKIVSIQILLTPFFLARGLFLPSKTLSFVSLFYPKAATLHSKIFFPLLSKRVRKKINEM